MRNVGSILVLVEETVQEMFKTFAPDRLTHLSLLVAVGTESCASNYQYSVDDICIQ
jgi:hypothetical protein